MRQSSRCCRSERGPTLPHGRAQPARRHRHLLEYRPSRRSSQTAGTRRADRRARAPGPHLTRWVGPHPAHRRIPVAKAPIAALAYDSAPYQSRPAIANASSHGDVHPIRKNRRLRSWQPRGLRCADMLSHLTAIAARDRSTSQNHRQRSPRRRSIHPAPGLHHLEWAGKNMPIQSVSLQQMAIRLALKVPRRFQDPQLPLRRQPPQRC